MEKVGYEYMKNTFNVKHHDTEKHTILQSMSVSFMSSTKITSIMFDISIINQDSSSATMKIQLKNDSGRVVISEGILRWKVEAP